MKRWHKLTLAVLLASVLGLSYVAVRWIVKPLQQLTRAAQALSMSQSAASGSLSELESQFEVKLFDRLGKRLQLSELGQQLRPRAESLLEQARAL